MGRTVIEAVMGADDMTLVGGVDPGYAGQLLSDLVPGAPQVPVADSVQVGIDAWAPEVLVDFTRPEVVIENLRVALAAGVACVVGTTGFTAEALDEVRHLCRQHGTPALIAPN
ncbi:MAG TPA: 4-hydroxy-tetrahydrodipicolinate reductase, partial [Armatimonadota bacterium]|nr:4-hydroxy-tetrahydrodipicolinate reductase [Armatimonadota bacterium]